MRSRAGGIALFCLVAALCALAVWSRLTASDAGAPPTGVPGESSPETGFARDMAVHHAQAVEMADIIRGRSTDPLVASLATDIVLTQQNQIGRFFGWLDQWGLPPTGPTMEWMTMPMDHSVMGMPGMATREEVRTLAELPVPQAEVLFLRLMIRHHRGGVEMAQAILELSHRPEVLAAANAVIASQTAEISAMNDMLGQRGQPPT